MEYSPGDGGRPDFVSVRPGGSVLFEHRNLDGWGRQLFGSVSTANFFQPQDDLGFKIEYNHPYCKGEFDAEKSSFRTSIFNSRKISPVFAGGPLLDNVPSVWVDRAGMKATFTQNFASISLYYECSTGRNHSKR